MEHDASYHVDESMAVLSSLHLHHPPGIAAIDALLRVHCPLRALPADVVNIVRRFVDASLLVKLLRAMQAQASGATLDRLMQQHSNGMELTALERREYEPSKSRNGVERRLYELLEHDAPESRNGFERRLYQLLKYAAEVGSVRVVERIVAASSSLEVTGALVAAAAHGHIAILELPAVRNGRRWADVNRRMRVAAAQSGHLETYQWLCAHPMEPNDLDRQWEARYPDPRGGYDLACAAMHGHLAILQWAYAERRDEWQLHVLKHAALFNQQHVMEWIYTEDIETDVPGALQALAYIHSSYCDVDWDQRFEAIVWLYDKYPALSMCDAALRALSDKMHDEMPMNLFLKYPERYPEHRIPT